jgi:hypothetical protein
MSSALALEKHLRRLVAYGKECGGYITYEVILSTVDSSVSMEAIDLIHGRLAAAGIEIVDQLPDDRATGGRRRDSSRRVGNYGHRAKVTRTVRRRGRRYTAGEGPVWPGPCPEEAIDELLCKAENGRLSVTDVFTAISECRLSMSDSFQLFEYLGLRGIDSPSVSQCQLCSHLTRVYGIDDEAGEAHRNEFVLYTHHCRRPREELEADYEEDDVPPDDSLLHTYHCGWRDSGRRNGLRGTRTCPLEREYLPPGS